MSETDRAHVGRRRFARLLGATLASAGLETGRLMDARVHAQAGDPARLKARPRPGVSLTLQSGPLGLGGGGAARDGLVQLPSKPGQGALPLLVFLHGATQASTRMWQRIGQTADEAGLVVLLPDSRGITWDAIRGEFGDDIAFLNRALDRVFARAPIDPARVFIGGFSDGASYALSLGVANGDLFSRVLACSPGFVMPTARQGRPRFFVSHGTSDQILPIDQCSRVIVPRLRAMGYDTTYREFEGRHELPPAIQTEAFRWALS